MRILFFGLFFGLFSCQPKDIDLRALSAATKASQSNASNNFQSVQMTEAEINSIFTLSLDRMAEAVFLMKAVLNPEFAATHFLNLLKHENLETSDDLPEMFLESVVSDQQMSQQKKMNTISSVNYKVDDFLVDASGKLKKLVLVKNIFKSAIAKGDLNTKKGDFNIKNTSDQISVQLTTEPNIYLVKIYRVDETSSKSDKNTTLNSEIKFKLGWSGDVASLNNKMNISNILILIDRTGAKKGQINFINNQESLTLSMGQCASLNGRLSINTNWVPPEQKMTNPTELIIIDSTFEILNSKFKSVAQACEIRPIVDLTRLLN